MSVKYKAKENKTIYMFEDLLDLGQSKKNSWFFHRPIYDV